MVRRIYVERKPGFAQEAAAVAAQLTGVLGLRGVTGVRLLNRYDVEGMDDALFARCISTVFSEPQTDDVAFEMPDDCGYVVAVEYLPGQYDQRADAAEQCVQLISQGERPTVRTARVYIIHGTLSPKELSRVKAYLINPVECREAAKDLPRTLKTDYPAPPPPGTLTGFTLLSDDGLAPLVAQYGLAMDAADLALCRAYFAGEDRDPSVTELRVLDTYWSDHCRHTTFNTHIEAIAFEDPAAEEAYRRYIDTRRALGRENKPVTLMDMGTIAVKALRAKGLLEALDVSPEINACTVKVNITVDGREEPWLLLFKNETHNHPTEIEPFGGAATCLGGAIRDPLSGRAYVYQAMRLTGAADPRKSADETLPGKLSQRKICTSAAAGYSAYGNEIGLATGLVDELYHEGYEAKRMEIGAVVGAAPAANVRREEPLPGDVVLLIGGKTGRDGCGGATGSSKAHTSDSLATCGAEVQKGNAPEERKLQRLFRNGEAARLIKRCNDFGAGGVSVAIGELADGLEIELDAVPRKYEGLDGTELAISESQERMAVVVDAADETRFIALAKEENLSAVRVARVTQAPRLVMKLAGRTIVDLSREFIDTNGAAKRTSVRISAPKPLYEKKDCPADRLPELFLDMLRRPGVASRRGLAERFDSTIGAATVVMPFGGRLQRSPEEVMAAKLPVPGGNTDDCSVMAWGFDPYLCAASPYRGAYLSVAMSLCKLAASGADARAAYLSVQEYFPKPGADPTRWGLPAAAVLGAFAAELDFDVAAIGGKDSMSGSFEKLDVPPTLVSFAIAMAKASMLITPDFKLSGSRAVLLAPQYGNDGLPDAQSLKKLFGVIREAAQDGRILSCRTLGEGGAAEAIFKLATGGGFGFRFEDDVTPDTLFDGRRCAFVAELSENARLDWPLRLLGRTDKTGVFTVDGWMLPLSMLDRAYDAAFESVYAEHAGDENISVPSPVFRENAWPRPAVRSAVPGVLIPVFPGTNCEYDSARAVERAGARANVMVINTMSAGMIKESVDAFASALAQSRILFIPGGFSGADEPDGSGKFITAFMRNPAVADGIAELLGKRDGLILGICNGFQALVKLGLVPFGALTEPDAASPTLTFNTIGRHQSKIVRTRIASNKSPWLMKADPDAIYSVPISHGEGRFMADEKTLSALAANGQIATQYTDLSGVPSMDIRTNPAGSLWAVEGVTSPDGRVFGKMGHSERIGKNLYRNVPGIYDMKLFESAVEYFK